MIHFESDGPPVRLPPWLVGATLGFVLLAIGLVVAARSTGVGVVVQTLPAREAMSEARIIFESSDDGTVRVLDAEDGEELHRMLPGEGGFMRGVLRPLARERNRRQVDVEEPYRLRRWSEERITLEDPATELVVEVAAFGPTSLAAFARLLE